MNQFFNHNLVIKFEYYEPLHILTKILKLWNRYEFPRRVSIIHPENILFQVLSYKTSTSSKSIHVEGEPTNIKVASSIEVSYLINYTTEPKVNIAYDLVVIIER